ncbi:MAG: NADH-quinone oxidoreductase subunit A [Candidatus Sumerlaeaceae bacterium]|nr:NADH-quinone oxidoreductase subunit A [Candidatus Sumerlaeaceae bacterium]
MVAIIVFSLVILSQAVAAVVTSYLLGIRRHNAHKDMPFESGIAPTGDARLRMAIPYYLVAIMFILFDVEILYLYPYALVVRELSWPGLIKAMIFLFFVFAGLVYIWLRGGLIWRHLSRTAFKKASSSQS